MEFGDWIVDEERNVVCCRGKARFLWKSTGVAWDEVFYYRLGMVLENEDEERSSEGNWKVESYEVWADSGAL